jgi:hypothetical protein
MSHAIDAFDRYMREKIQEQRQRIERVASQQETRGVYVAGYVSALNDLENALYDYNPRAQTH